MDDFLEQSDKALSDILQSKERLSELVARLTNSVAQLEATSELHEELRGLIGENKQLLQSLDESTSTLAEPLRTIEEKLEQRQASQEAEFSQRLAALETRIGELVRTELRETRDATRDRIENVANELRRDLAEAARQIIAEMPSTVFGRRGK